MLIVRLLLPLLTRYALGAPTYRSGNGCHPHPTLHREDTASAVLDSCLAQLVPVRAHRGWHPHAPGFPLLALPAAAISQEGPAGVDCWGFPRTPAIFSTRGNR
ncbi:hypothetical protein [Streptomyces sp. NPDC059256]|uniref:hypothetical protein n=1 Tax=Streptomyces sp. NPDC059256 TaxID=3346794 RepID=UPI00369DF6A1